MVRETEEEMVFSGEEGEEEPAPIAVAESERRVYSDQSDPTIEGLYKRYHRGKLLLQPEFQRGYIWDDKKASRLVESVLLDVPIPNFYLSEEQDGSESVIDGQQRLTSFFRVFQPIQLRGKEKAERLKLGSLRVLTHLNGRTFDQWGEYQSKFEEAAMRVVMIRKQSDPDVRYEIFERLNSGSMGLNDQELRNCVYRGDYNRLLHELSEDRDFLFVLGWKKPDKRMRDIELVLRFFAFDRATYLNYRSPMKAFLNKEMDQCRFLNQGGRAEKRARFKNAVSLAKTVFGTNAFRRFVPGTEKDPNGDWERSLNRALYDVVMFGFTRYPKHQVMQHADAIREELISLMTHDQEFVDSLMLSTSGVPRVQTRFDKWSSALQRIVGQMHQEPRLFPLRDKEALFSKLAGATYPECPECRQKILTIDDAEVDHAEPYSRGGKTDLSNARLLHRYCNRKRGARESAFAEA